MPARLWVARLALTLLVAHLCACEGDLGASEPKELRELSLRSASPEDQSAQLLGASRFTHRETLDQIAEVAREDNVTGLFLRIGSFRGAWARAAELRDALLAVRKAKKPLHCYFENTDNVGYALLARVCDRISMTPSGLLNLVGVHAQLVYARELLETLGLKAELMQVGRFKGAADMLTRDTMPQETQQIMSALLDDLQSELTSSVMQGRSISAADLAQAIDAGPQTASAALRLRLIDAVAFDDEARAKAKAAAKAERWVAMPEHPVAEHKGLLDLLRALTSDKSEERPSGHRLALAYLEGTISEGDEGSESGASAGPFVKEMRRLADDLDVRAVVVRINSPGGSALASDRMWHALRRVAKRKPVIVSVGDMAASGGYYVACAGTEIFVEDTSLVGSIGVVGGKFAAEALAQRVGVHAVELSRGKHAGWMSPLRTWSDDERAALLQALQNTYDTFLSRVSEGRHLQGDKLIAVAEGRLMTGRRAREAGLADSQGGLTLALARARSKGQLAADTPIEVWPQPHNLLERLAQTLGGSSAQSLGLQGVSAALGTLGDSPITTGLLRGDTGPFAALPYALEIH